MSVALKINEVFTPRTTTINLRTYIPRISLETALARSVQGSLHSVLFGESGNGKSWLYRKVFTQLGFHYKVANCANACRSRSVAAEIHAALMPRNSTKKTAFSETREATPSEFSNSGALSTQEQFAVRWFGCDAAKWIRGLRLA